ncbi:ribonuclease H-like domain-containing protein, partial [Tanacetum coccineum]
QKTEQRGGLVTENGPVSAHTIDRGIFVEASWVAASYGIQLWVYFDLFKPTIGASRLDLGNHQPDSVAAFSAYSSWLLAILAKKGAHKISVSNEALSIYKAKTCQKPARIGTEGKDSFVKCDMTRNDDFLCDNLLTWSSKRQDTLSCFSAEAEYRGVANAVAETSWIRNLLRELHTPLSTATLVYCDNVSAVYMSASPVQHQRTKHIEINIHFVRDKVAAAGHVRVLHVPSRFQYAHIFTKGLPYPLFADFRQFEHLQISRSNCGGVLEYILYCIFSVISTLARAQFV